MQKYTNHILSLFAVLAVIAAITSGTLRGQNQNSSTLIKQEEADENQEPIVSYETSELSDLNSPTLRKIRGSRYDKRSPKPIEELPVGIEPLPEIDHWLSQLPALPITKSDTVLIAEIVDAQAHLSNDKTGVYSEFNVRIDDVLKDDNRMLLTVSNPIVVERTGGAVRFSSGRIQRYRILNQGMPQVGRQYLLFLKYNEQGQDFFILTGYELREGRVFPLDGHSPGRNGINSPFSVYYGVEESNFLNAVRNAIAKPSQTSAETKR